MCQSFVPAPTAFSSCHLAKSELFRRLIAREQQHTLAGITGIITTVHRDRVSRDHSRVERFAIGITPSDGSARAIVFVRTDVPPFAALEAPRGEINAREGSRRELVPSIVAMSRPL